MTKTDEIEIRQHKVSRFCLRLVKIRNKHFNGVVDNMVLVQVGKDLNHSYDASDYEIIKAIKEKVCTVN